MNNDKELAALIAVKACLEKANSDGLIKDTIWIQGSPETLFDFIDSAIEQAARAEVAGSVKQTDLSKRLLAATEQNSGPMRIIAISVLISDLTALCREVDRYYTGMLNWKAAAEAKDEALASQSPSAPVVPELPEIESEADIEYLKGVPEDWDDDYRSIWGKLQVESRNKMQWRSYALQLRSRLAAAPSPQAKEST